MLQAEENLLDPPLTPEEIIEDYRLVYKSRQSSLIGRREVMSGKAKFGIFGDGKEVAQIAMAKAFKKGDFRSGYYRDITFMLAIGATSIQEQFAQLYAHADLNADPSSGGRQMNAHFSTRSLNPDGSWRNIANMYNSSPDTSPTAAQMPRLTGLAYASRLFREIKELQIYGELSKNGDEIAFGTIGNASCAEGSFWETVNAVGVLKAPMLLSIWDDGYGISVPNKFQMVKQDIGALLEGFRREPGSNQGYDLYKVRGWDYPELVRTYLMAADIVREDHIPAIIHVTEATQPQGHSTSGSHERYKSPERLAWELEYDCVTQMRNWMLDEGVASEKELARIETEDRLFVEEIRKTAWEAYQLPIRKDAEDLVDILEEIVIPDPEIKKEIKSIQNNLENKQIINRAHIIQASHEALISMKSIEHPGKNVLINWKNNLNDQVAELYSKNLHSQTQWAVTKVPVIKAKYSKESPMVPGYKIMNRCFDGMLGRDPRVIAFGEDVGHIGDVNQGFAGLQAKYGPLRVSDTGIRENTIIGQGIGLAIRGLRPIAEIQYLDYILYGLQTLSDDLATLLWRSNGGQKAPVIVRTRGHRLEGIWHSGSQMAGLLHLVRGINVLVPRNMVQAAGFYNTLLLSDEPAIVVEVLNGYRLRERLPDNITDFTVPVGVPEVLRQGTDVTVVTYGPLCRITADAAAKLSRMGIEIEIIDVQSLLPFDIHGIIVESLKKTNRVLFLDEDVPGGTTGYMMREVLEKQGGFSWLDSEPRTLSGAEHRPAYGNDGNYWSKPGAETIFEAIYEMMHDADPAEFPLFY